MSRSSSLLLAVVALAFLSPTFAWAQDQDRREQFRQERMNRLKEALGSNDEEWKVIQPKIQKVMDAQRQSFAGGGFGGRGGPGGGGGRGQGGGDAQQPTTELGKASQDLRTTLENKDAPADDIAKKLAAVRDAREKARAAMAAAQKELKEVLTQRQEALLVTMGTLE